MLIWFLLALGSAIMNSFVQAGNKWAGAVSRYSKYTITFVATATAGLILLAISYFVVGLPKIDSRFWVAALITGVSNGTAFPIMIRAYQLGEFSSVYSMILLTPVFLLFTSFLFLGEIPSWFGILGVILAVFGLWVITRSKHEHVQVPNFAKGNWLGILVALIYSITVNFDKLSTIYSNRFFAPAIGLLVMAVMHGAYLLIKHRSFLIKETQGNIPDHHDFSKIFILLFFGLIMAISQVFHNSALLAGPASYTIAIKRTGVLLGVFWGWLFFHEKNIAKKLFGAAIAVAGVLLILFLG